MAPTATDYLTANGRGPQVAVEGYVTAFWWAAAIFAVGALVCGARLRSDLRPEMSRGPAPEPAPAGGALSQRRSVARLQQ